MVKVIFKCCENMNKYEEEFEFEDDVTDEEIQEEYADWVWSQVSDNFTWYRVEE